MNGKTKAPWLEILQGKAGGVLWLLLSSISAALGARYGVAIFDLSVNILGRRLLVSISLVLLVSLFYLLLDVFKLRRRKSVFDRLIPVKGKGYCRDPKTGEAVCPRCTIEKKVVFMSDHSNGLYCYSCGLGVLK